MDGNDALLHYSSDQSDSRSQAYRSMSKLLMIVGIFFGPLWAFNGFQAADSLRVIAEIRKSITLPPFAGLTSQESISLNLNYMGIGIASLLTIGAILVLLGFSKSRYLVLISTSVLTLIDVFQYFLTLTPIYSGNSGQSFALVERQFSITLPIFLRAQLYTLFCFFVLLRR